MQRGSQDPDPVAQDGLQGQRKEWQGGGGVYEQLEPPPLPRGRGGIGRSEVRIPSTSLASAVQQDWPLCPVARRPQASPQPCSAPLL